LSWVIFTFGCDSPSQQGSRGRSTLEHPSIALASWSLGSGHLEGPPRLWASAVRHPSKIAEAPSAPPSRPRREPGGFSPLLFECALCEGIGDGEVAHDEGTSEEQADRHEPHDAAPAFETSMVAGSFTASSTARQRSGVHRAPVACEGSRASARSWR